jgi:hypothetical protein
MTGIFIKYFPVKIDVTNVPVVHASIQGMSGYRDRGWHE